MFELRDRVHRGAELLKWFHSSSAWVREVLDPSFTIKYLCKRAYQQKEDSYFAGVYKSLDRNRCYRPHRLTPPEFFGFDLENGAQSQDMHFKFMDDLWRAEAHTILASLIQPRG